MGSMFLTVRYGVRPVQIFHSSLFPAVKTRKLGRGHRALQKTDDTQEEQQQQQRKL